MSRQVGATSKPSRQKYRKYDTGTLNHAVELIKTKAISLRQASVAFNIPKATLSNKIRGKTAMDCKSGPPTVLTKSEENMLAEWAVNMAKMGFGRTRSEILDTVQKILNDDNRQNPFTKNRPGKDWYYAFLKRHPILSARSPQQLAKERAVINPERVRSWFRDFSSFMAEECADPTLWRDPSRWFNADESGFPLCPKSEKVLAPRGVPNIYNFTSSDKTQITVLACMNASGFFLQPLIVFAGQRFSTNPLADFPEAIFGRTMTGWMDSDLFVTWLRDVFSPSLDEKNIKRPVVLYVDGHSTHATLAASKFCRENQIILYCLLEHASHLMQPCDISLFSTLKSTWKQSVRNFQISNVGDFVTKAKFAKVFKPAWEKACTIDVSVKGFKESGLFPLDPSKVTDTLKMEPSKIFAKSSPSSTSTSTITCADQVDKPDEETPSTTSETLGPNNTEISSTATPSTSTCESSTSIPDKPDEVTPSTTSETLGPNDTELSSTATPSASTLSASTPSIPQGLHRTETSVTKPAGSPDIPPDHVSSLNKASVGTPNTSSRSGKTDYVSPVLEEVLKLPIAAKHDNKSVKRRVVLPKAISGKKFHDMLVERQRQKELELKQKEARKIEREEKKIKMNEEKERKAKEREQKRLIKERKVMEKEQERKILQKRKAHESDSDSDVSMVLADDELQDIDINISKNCYSCEIPYDNSADDWVVCQKCDRWLHKGCVKTIDLLSMSISEIADLGFECDYC